jgi:hypothetical protein
MRAPILFWIVIFTPLVATAGEAEVAYEHKDYERCALLYAEAAQAGKQAPLNYYSAACCLALGGKVEPAAEALEKSLALEPEGLAEMKKDADLASVVKTPRFAALERKAAAALAATQKSQNGPLREELGKMADADQALRMKPGSSAEQIMTVDKKNTQRMKAIVAKHGWPGIKLVGKHAATAAWLLVQHADADPAFQKLCLEKMLAAAKQHDVDPVNVAYLADRVALAEGKKQVYGTQFLMEPGQFEPRPIEDETHVDERRADLGLEPMAEYAKEMRAKYPEQAAAAAADSGVLKH